jgi:hypothetical protein
MAVGSLGGTMTVKRLILHVGHGKTGSTAIQSALALSEDALRDRGVAYPQGPEREAAVAGNVTSGNGMPKALLSRAEAALRGDADRIVFSNETLFRKLQADEALLDALARLGATLEFVLFIRDPLGHALSSYGQSIKRGGATHDLPAFLAQYAMPGRVETFLDLASSRGIPVRVLNYSRHANDVVGAFAALLALPPDCFRAPPRARINRSLTRAELRLQRAFNAALKVENKGFISDAWCNALPDVQSELPFLSREDYARFAARMEPQLASANARLPVAERYAMESYDEVFGPGAGEGDDLFTFSGAQLDVVARALAGRVGELADPNAFKKLARELEAGKPATAEQVAQIRKAASVDSSRKPAKPSKPAGKGARRSRKGARRTPTP